MFLTSGDILNWVLVICAIALTFFLCWAVYYFVVATHKFYRLIKRVEKGVTKVEEILETVHGKINNSAPYMMMFSEVVKQAMTFIKDRKNKKKANPTPAATKKK